jgi:uncharacterized protein YhaN
MRIASIEVQGFGVLRERTLHTDSPLALFYGANEAGKSTLMGFVRAMLFGFPSRTNRTERYEPLKGGAHGGALTLLDEQGRRIRVERYDSGSGTRRSSAGIVKVTLSDGTTGGEELLGSLLGGLSADLFRSLFAFGLGELQELRTLQSEEISGYLYSAGLGISGSAIMEAERKLAAQMDNLFKPRGRNQEIHLLLKEMEELEQSIRRSKERTGEYDRLQEERRSQEQQIAVKEQHKQELRLELEGLLLGSKARNSWVRMKQIEGDLRGLPILRDFPERASARLEALEDEIERNHEDKARMLLKQNSLASRFQNMKLDAKLLVHKIELNSLLEQVPVMQETERALIESQAELEQRRLELDRLLKQLDEGWEPSSLAAFPVSISLRERVRTERDRFMMLDEEAKRLYADREHVSQQLARLDEAMQSLEQEMQAAHRAYPLTGSMPDGLAAGDGQDLARKLNRIARDYAQWRLLRSESEHKRERFADLQLYQQQLLESNSQAKRDTDKRQRILASMIAGIALIVTGVLLWQGNIKIAALIFVGLAIIAGIVYVWGRGSAGRANRPFNLSLSESGSVEEEKAAMFEQQLIQLQGNLERQVTDWLGWQEASAAKESAVGQGKLSASAESWRITLNWLDTQLEDLLLEAEEWKHQRGELQRKKEKLNDLRYSRTALAQQDEQITAELDRLEQRSGQLLADWHSWVQSLGISGKLSPDALLESLSLVERGHELLRQVEKLEARLALQQERLQSFEAAVVAFLGLGAGGGPHLALKRWKEQEQEQLLLLEEQQRLQQQTTEGEQELALLEERMKRTGQRLEQLLLEARAKDGEQLRLHEMQMSQRTKLLEEQKLLQGAMESLAGSAGLAELQALLELVGEEELDRRKSDLERQMKQSEAETNELRELSGKLSNELEKLELGTEHADKLQKLEEQKAALQQMVDRYAKASFAALLIRKAREVYEQERQPAVLIRASGYFEKMTRGRFIQIKAPFGEQRLVAMRANGEAVDTGYLSRGTAEQLYLSMRFALAEEYAGKAVLPLVMDDILVNFDGPRMESCLEVLRELSGRHQILLFTCHTHVRDSVKRMIPEHGIIKL